MTSEKKLPTDLEAEKQVAAYLVGSGNSTDGIAAVLEILTPADFHQPELKSIIEAVEALHGEAAAVDSSAVASMLHRWGVAKPTHRDMQRLVLEVGTSKTVALSAARRVGELSRWRNLIFLGESIRPAFERGGSTVTSALEQLLEDAGGLMQRDEMPYTSMDRALVERDEELTHAAGNPVRRTLTGFAPFDTITGGLGDGEMITIAAPTGGGKSALTLMLLDLLAHANHPTLIASAEMDSWELADRIFARMCQIDGRAVMANKLTPEQRERMHAVARDEAYGRIYAMTNRQSMTVQRIHQTARKLQRNAGLSAVAVDYLQLISPMTGSFDRGRTREAEVAAVSRGMKSMARELGVPVIALSQFSRGFQKEGREPELYDLRESGSIEQDSNQVVFLWPPNPEDESTIRMKQAKHRSNEANTHVTLRFNKAHMTFDMKKQSTVEKNKQERLDLQQRAAEDHDSW